MRYRRKAERWKPVEGFPDYEISSYGRVFNTKTGRFLKCGIPGKGRPAVNLYNSNGKYKRFFVYRLVASAFIDNPNNYPEVNHINGNVWDSYFENLEWCTPFQNKLHCQYFELMENGQAKKGELLYIKMPCPMVKEMYSIMKRDYVTISKLVSAAVEEYIANHKGL